MTRADVTIGKRRAARRRGVQRTRHSYLTHTRTPERQRNVPSPVVGVYTRWVWAVVTNASTCRSGVTVASQAFLSGGPLLQPAGGVRDHGDPSLQLDRWIDLGASGLLGGHDSVDNPLPYQRGPCDTLRR